MSGLNQAAQPPQLNANERQGLVCTFKALGLRFIIFSIGKVLRFIYIHLRRLIQNTIPIGVPITTISIMIKADLLVHGSKAWKVGWKKFIP